MSRKYPVHQEYISGLRRRLGPGFDRVWTNYEYSRGEIDMLGVRDGVYHVYEVKCGDGRKARRRAIEQLRRAEIWLKKPCRKFYYCGRLDSLEEMR
jgi:Holliday junction resolvase-like predicted endonuclease